MHYSIDFCNSLRKDHLEAQNDLQDVLIVLFRVAQPLSNSKAKEYLLQGAARRLRLLQHCLSNVFKHFPPENEQPINLDDLYEVQISLHAFVMNVYGLFENLAWSFVFRHELENQIGNRKKIGLFLKETQQHLPAELSSYLTSETTVRWHSDYLKNYRDALAHRIPLYIPPSTFTEDQGNLYKLLEDEKIECIVTHKWERLEQIHDEQEKLGCACPMFLHSFSDDEPSKPLYLHPQMLCDVKTVIEFCSLYFEHWDKRIYP